MRKTLLAALLSVGTYAGYSQGITMLGTEAFIQGNSVEIGIAGSGGYEGANCVSSFSPVIPPGFHFRSGTQYFGFVANPQVNAWATFDGDFFTPGTPENGWGIEIGESPGIILNNNCAGPVEMPGSVTNTVYDAGCLSLDHEGNIVTGGYNIGYKINYQLNENDLFYTTTVTFTNNGTTPISKLYYHRNLDPDNNQTLSGSFDTQNTIVHQPNPSCTKALVSATQSSPWNSYMGLAAFGENFRVTYGGFGNRDASEIWNGGFGFTQTVGSSTFSDIAISLAYMMENIDPGESVTFRFVVILDATQADEAINNLMYFNYVGALADPPVCIANIDSAVSCSGNPLIIEYTGSIQGDFEWTWSPATGLDTTGGLVVQASPADTTLYTVTGTPTTSCFSLPIVSQIVVIPVTGPDLLVTQPGVQCNDYDLGNLVFTDQNSTPGSSTLYLTTQPTSAADSANVFAGTIVYPGDSVYLFVSEPVLGCYDYEFINIEWSPGFAFEIDEVRPTCLDNDGSLEVINVVGNAGPVTYQWTGGPTTAMYNGLVSASYTVQVTDSVGCVEDTTYYLSNTTTLQDSIVRDLYSECGVANGQFTVYAYNGDPTYMYSIYGGTPQASGVFSGLSDSTYVVAITDEDGCQIFDMITIIDTSTLALALTATLNENCGNDAGQITVTGSGGGTPLTYTIGSTSQPTGVFTGMGAGTYNIIVTDVGGCADTVTAVISNVPNLVATLADTTSATCGVANGGVSVDAINGTGTYNYAVGSAGNTTGDFTGLAPGVYVMLVTSGTCMVNVPFTIVNVNNLTASLVDVDSSVCIANNGAVSVQASNGTGTYVYTIPGSSNSSGTFTGLAPGTYNMNITSGTCVQNVPFTITQDPGNLSLSLVSESDENCGIHNGEIVTQASGGTAPFAFTNGAAPQTSGTFTGLNNGSFVVAVTDANGCFDTVHASVNEIPLVIDLGPDTTFCNLITLQSNAVADHLWSTGDMTNTLNVTTTGLYSLTVSTSECSATDSIFVTVYPDPKLFVPNVFTPNGDGQNDEFAVNGVFIEDYQINIFNRWGQEVFSSNNLDNPWNGKFNGNTVGEGTYMYVLRYVNQCAAEPNQVQTGSVNVFR